MRSMTGYGRGEAAKDGFKFTVELNSINRKQSDISINLAKELVELEPRIRDEINAHLSRGRVMVVVAFHRSSAKAEEQVELETSVRAGMGADASAVGGHEGLADRQADTALFRGPA